MFGSARVFTSTSFNPKTKLRGEARSGVEEAETINPIGTFWNHGNQESLKLVTCTPGFVKDRQLFIKVHFYFLTLFDFMRCRCVSKAVFDAHQN